MLAFGAFARRLQVRAQEDVFDATRERMAAVVEEVEKNKAREITTTSSSIKTGRRGVALPGGSVGAKSMMSSASSTSSTSHGTSAAQLFDAASAAKRKMLERQQAAKAQAHQQAKGSSTPTSQSTSQQSGYSLRDRVLYSLAIRPQNESQLIQNLKISPSRGESSVDLLTICKQLCYPLTPSNNSYHLRRENIADIKLDHPLIKTPEEKVAVKRIIEKAQMHRSSHRPLPVSTPVGGSSSALSHSSSSSDLTSTQQASAPPTKQRRMDSPGDVQNQHHSSTTTTTTTLSQQTRSTPFGDSEGKQHKPKLATAVGRSHNQHHHGQGLVSSGVHKLNGNNNTLNSNLNTSELPSFGRVAPSSATNKPGFGNTNNKSDKGSSKLSGTKDFSLKSERDLENNSNNTTANNGHGHSNSSSPVIQNREQRAEMKTQFNNDYNEYKRLHSILSERTRFFNEVRPQLEQLDPNSEDYKKLEQRVREAYAKFQQDSSWEDQKRKLQELHDRLARIKEAIEEYDHGASISGSSLPASSNSSSPVVQQQQQQQHSSTAAI